MLGELRRKSRSDILRTINPNCPACRMSRLHTRGEWLDHHPDAGSGSKKGEGKV